MKRTLAKLTSATAPGGGVKLVLVPGVMVDVLVSTWHLTEPPPTYETLANLASPVTRSEKSTYMT
jgi:hypothetical protein